MIIDLHVHTTASDGLYSPEQIIQRAAEKNISRYGNRLNPHHQETTAAPAARVIQ